MGPHAPESFPNPEGDISLARNGKWFVNSYKIGDKNYYADCRRTLVDFTEPGG